MTEDTDKLNTPVGNIEPTRLEAKPVKCISSQIVGVNNSAGKRVGEKVLLMCKHPAKPELLQLSSIKYEKNNRTEFSALWFNPDAEGKITKGSALAHFLNFYGCKVIKDIDGKELQTCKDPNDYLTIKCY